PQGIGMIQQYFRGEERGRAFGYFGTTVGLSAAIGPVLGGVLIKLGGLQLGWRLTFLINVPFGVLALVLRVLWFPKPLTRKIPRPSNAHARRQQGLRSLDPIGAVILGLAVLATLFPFVESRTSPLTWLLLPLGLVLYYLWVKWEQRYARTGNSPMVDLNIFRTASFTNGTIIMTLYFLGMTSIWVLVALYIQDGNGMSALQSGMFGVPASLLAAYMSHWAGKRVMRYGRIVVIIGLLMAIVGLVLSSAVVILHEIGNLNVWWLMFTLSFI